jgi:hypothetical protein
MNVHARKKTPKSEKLKMFSKKEAAPEDSPSKKLQTKMS